MVGRVIEETEPVMAHEMCQNRIFPAEGFKNLTFRNALNKIAHLDAAASTFRIDGRDHFLLLSGQARDRKSGIFIAELDVRALATTSLGALSTDGSGRSSRSGMSYT